MFKAKRIPQDIVNKALEILELHLTNQLQARVSNKRKYLVLNVGRNYRLLNKGSKWELLTHQQYNTAIDR